MDRSTRDLLHLWCLIVMAAFGTLHWHLSWIYFVWGISFTIDTAKRRFRVSKSLDEEYSLVLAISGMLAIAVFLRSIQLTFF